MARIRLDWHLILGFDQASTSVTNEPTAAISRDASRLTRIGARVGQKADGPVHGLASRIGAKVGGKEA